LELLWVRFAGADSDYYVRVFGKEARALALNAKTSARITDLFRQMFESVEAQDSNHCGQLIHASHLLRLLLSHLLCNSGANQTREPHHPAVESAFAFMQSHLDSVLTLADIARRAGLSASHFCTVFREQTGQTPMDYFIRMKIHKAQHLLVNSAMTVQEIAQQVGYEDRYYFSRLFRKLLGVPPVEYRKVQRTGLL
jgi:transcriptional regulator GlxA family with amidase domain